MSLTVNICKYCSTPDSDSSRNILSAIQNLFLNVKIAAKPVCDLRYQLSFPICPSGNVNNERLRFMCCSHHWKMAAVATKTPSDMVTLLYQSLYSNLQCGTFVPPFCSGSDITNTVTPKAPLYPQRSQRLLCPAGLADLKCLTTAAKGRGCQQTVDLNNSRRHCNTEIYRW